MHCHLQGWSPLHRFVFAWCTIVLPVAYAGAATISVPPALSVAPDTSFTIPVHLSPAAGVLGYYFEFAYDEGLITFVGATDGALTTGWPAPSVNAQPNLLAVAQFGTTALTGSGSILVLHFKSGSEVAHGQTTSLDLRNAELNDGAIVATMLDGQLAISGVATVSLPTGTLASPARDAVMPVRVDHALGANGYVMTFAYDPNVVDYIEVSPGDLTAGWTTPTVNESVPGQLTVAAVGAQPAIGPGILLQLHVYVTGNQLGLSPIHIASAELNDGAIPVTTQHGSINVLANMPIHFATAITIVLTLAVAASRRMKYRYCGLQ